MEWLNTATSFLNNPTVSSLAQSLIPKSKPAAPPSYSPVISAPSPLSVPEASGGGGLSTNKMLMIGGGVLALVIALIFVFKKK